MPAEALENEGKTRKKRTKVAKRVGKGARQAAAGWAGHGPPAFESLRRRG